MTPPTMLRAAGLDAAALTAAYEHLRAWAAGQASAGGRPAGLALFLRRGVTGWLVAAPTWLPTAAAATRLAVVTPGSPVDRPANGPTLVTASVAAADLTDVLATMVAAVTAVTADAARTQEGR